PKYQRNYLSKMRAHLLEPPPPVSDIRQDVPPEVVAILDRMLAKEPEDRYASAADIVYALEPFCAGHRLYELLGTGDRPSSGFVTQPVSHPSGSLPSPQRSSVAPASQPPSVSQAVPATASPGARIALIAFGLVGAIGIGVLLSQLIGKSNTDLAATGTLANASITGTDDSSKAANQASPPNGAGTNEEAKKNESATKGDGASMPSTPSTSEGQVQPTIKAVADTTIQEKQRYNVKIRVENESQVKGKYQFALSADAPDGSYVNPETGQFSWTPGENHGPGEFDITVQLNSQDESVADATVSWTVKVQEVNDPPVLEQPQDQIIDELTTLEFIAQAKDLDEPANDIRFELTGEVPEGAVIDPKNGAFSWKPTEAQGPGEFKFTLQVVDDGENSRRDFKAFSVQVMEKNLPPAFSSVVYQRASEEGVGLLGPGETLKLSMSAKDDDLPPQKLTYQLGEGAPERIQFDAETGELTWSIHPDDVGKDFKFDVLAIETEGDEPLTARHSLSFHIERYIENSIGMRLAYIPAGRFKMGNMSGEAELPGLPGIEDLIPSKEKDTPEPPTPFNPIKSNVPASKPIPKIPEYPKDERPVRTIRLSRDFHISAYEVTQREYRLLMEDNPSYFSTLGEGSKKVGDELTDHFPVESVTWTDAVEFCRKLNELPEEIAAGRTYRLPTEAEWEYVCRAGKDAPYSTGAALSSKQANFNGTASVQGAEPGPFLERTAAVGSYAPNDWGVFDMHGNVAEWCQDWYSPKAYEDPVFEDPVGPQPEKPEDEKALESRVIRGGSWSELGFECRSSRRYRIRPYEKSRLVGFRVICQMPQAEPLSSAEKSDTATVGEGTSKENPPDKQ
ncbi:MAG: SUMF1/EgtB/PvdO family nonheme iron enzyme, partial [Planctomycetaceae bacterium]